MKPTTPSSKLSGNVIALEMRYTLFFDFSLDNGSNISTLVQNTNDFDCICALSIENGIRTNARGTQPLRYFAAQAARKRAVRSTQGCLPNVAQQMVRNFRRRNARKITPNFVEIL